MHKFLRRLGAWWYIQRFFTNIYFLRFCCCFWTVPTAGGSSTEDSEGIKVVSWVNVWLTSPTRQTGSQTRKLVFFNFVYDGAYAKNFIIEHFYLLVHHNHKNGFVSLELYCRVYCVKMHISFSTTQWEKGYFDLIFLVDVNETKIEDTNVLVSMITTLLS